MGAKYTGVEKYIFSDAYLLFLKYKDMQNNDYCWESFIRERCELLSKYRNHPLLRSMLDAVSTQIERIVKSEKINDLTREEWEVELRRNGVIPY